MRISNFNYKSYTPVKTLFKGTTREYGKIDYPACSDCFRNDTMMFRDDLDWINFVKFLHETFKHKEKVNIYSLAASDGSEGYSLLISLFETLSPKEYAKFLPIYASDQDPVIIELAANGNINLNEIELVDIQKHSKIGTNYFINPKSPIKQEDNNFCIPTFAYEPIEKLKNSIRFEQADILQRVLSLEDEGNSVLMCRNVTPYMEKTYLDRLLNAFQQILKQGSILVFGDYDMYSHIDCRLFGSGFIKQMKNVYKKV